MAYNWLTGQYDNVAGDWNAYNTYSGEGATSRNMGQLHPLPLIPAFGKVLAEV